MIMISQSHGVKFTDTVTAGPPWQRPPLPPGEPRSRELHSEWQLKGAVTQAAGLGPLGSRLTQISGHFNFSSFLSGPRVAGDRPTVDRHCHGHSHRLDSCQ